MTKSLRKKSWQKYILKGFQKGGRPEEEWKRKRELSEKLVKCHRNKWKNKRKNYARVCFVSACTKNAGGGGKEEGMVRQEIDQRPER